MQSTEGNESEGKSSCGGASVTSEVSSSGLEDTDVAIYFHEAICDMILVVEKILNQRGLRVCISTPAGRSKTENAISAARHSRLRAFVITRRFIEEDMPFHRALLENPTMSTKGNTLFLISGKQDRNLPPSMKHFRCDKFKDERRTQDIADSITAFIRSRHAQEATTANKSDVAVPTSLISTGEKKTDPRVDVTLEKQDSKFKRLDHLFGKFDKKRAYVLISSPVHNKSPGLQNVALIPWLRVFDFDPKSRVLGLLSEVEPALKLHRYYTITDSLDVIQNPDEKTTNWVFINGYTDRADTLHQENEDNLLTSIFNHSTILADFCVGNKVPTLLVLWYPSYSNMDKKLDHFLSGIRLVLCARNGGFKCIVCLRTMPDKRSTLYGTLDRLDLLDSTIIMPLETLCSWFQTCLQTVRVEQTSGKILPKYPEEGSSEVVVEEVDLKWIEVCLDILTMPRPNGQDVENQVEDCVVSEQGLAFLKGSEIRWKVIENEKYVANRDLMEDVELHIKNTFINTGKSGVIKIFHSPGGGGTTFARLLLWELRKVVPCVELMSSQVNFDELKDRLWKIQNLTRLPTALLVDGKGDRDIKKIMDISRHLPIIVLQIQRYYSPIEKPRKFEVKDTFYLPAWVSEKEAESLSAVYSRAEKTKKAKLEKLRNDVKQGRKHFVFEFGLTTFQSEFRGVSKYVHGYLQIRDDQELEDWHTVLAFLSMANFYGHKNLPSKLFSKILRKCDNEIVELEDLPHSAIQFITEDTEGNWKITHYIVSIVILEHILAKRSTHDQRSNVDQLTKSAKKELLKWALRFIDNVKEHFKDCTTIPGHIFDMLTAIFIRRYYNDPGENEVENKSQYSRLLVDTGSKDDQRDILKKLVECFPYKAEFLAHLGRFYSKQRQFSDAEDCLSRAVEKRLKEVSGNKGDDVLERIYNMFGFCFNSQVYHALGASLGFMKKNHLADKPEPTLVRKCLEKAQNAIKQFENGRKWYQKSSIPTFAYLGEVKVRLHVTELAHVITEGNLKSLESQSSPYRELREFVLTSFHECDQLLAHCIYHSQEKDIPVNEMNTCINNFQHFFKSAKSALEHWAGRDSSVHSKRCHICIMKMYLTGNKDGYRFRVYEDVNTSKELMKFIELHEGILDSAYKNEALNFRISNYMMEWLQAIRHQQVERQYTQTEVLRRVKNWVERKETGSLATFYHYILTTVLSICAPRGEVANVYSTEASRLKEQVDQHTIPLHLIGKTIEWLAHSENSQDFNKLIHLSALGEKNGKFWTEISTLSKFEVCTGTIHDCKTHSGLIVMDGGQKPPISIFFVPRNYGPGIALAKQRTRVQFYIGFNPRHKAEAFNVTLLLRYPCPACKTLTEVETLGRNQFDSIAQCMKCETMVRAVKE